MHTGHGADNSRLAAAQTAPRHGPLDARRREFPTAGPDAAAQKQTAAAARERMAVSSSRQTIRQAAFPAPQPRKMYGHSAAHGKSQRLRGQRENAHRHARQRQPPKARAAAGNAVVQVDAEGSCHAAEPGRGRRRRLRQDSNHAALRVPHRQRRLARHAKRI